MCAEPRNSIASNILPSTRAVSATDSLWPIWDPEGSRYVTWPPWSKVATSNAARVRVEVFSKISAISLPRSNGTSVPAYLACFNDAESSSRCSISPVEKSISLRKLRLRRLYMRSPSAQKAGSRSIGQVMQ